MASKLTGQEKQREMTRIQGINQGFYQDTGAKLKDSIYNKIIDRYTKNMHEFRYSDRFIWAGTVYAIPETIGYIIFFAIFLALAHISFNKYGEARTVVFFILLLIWRVQILVKLLSSINRKLK
jgi:hypothetical protein